MNYSAKTLEKIYYGLNELAKQDSRKMDCSIETSLAMDWGCSHGGTVSCISNQYGMYGFQGISIYYDWGNHCPGSTSGHNMCFSLDSKGSFYARDWVNNTPENQIKVAEVYVPLMAKLYGLSEEQLLEYGIKAKRKADKLAKEQKLYSDYKKYLMAYAEPQNLRNLEVGSSPLDYKAWKKANK